MMGDITCFFIVRYNYSKLAFQKIIESNSLDPYQGRQFVGPDLGSNCLQRTGYQ